jgi:rubrerythrin
MDFLNLALQMEDQTIAMYKDLAEKCFTHEGIRKILLMLAGDHEKHSLTLAKLKNKGSETKKKSQALDEAERLFARMRKDRETFSCDMDQLQLYRDARNFLQKKVEFYKEMSTQLDTKDAQTLLKNLMAEEQKQLKVLDNIIEMVSRPENWLDNAEYFHLEEY